MKLLTLLLIIVLLPITVIGQKTVRVREYRRKDGTVVRTRTRRPPQSTAPAPPVIGYEPSRVSSDLLLDLSRLVIGEGVDLGGGSYYVAGGTGLTRPRRVKPQQ